MNRTNCVYHFDYPAAAVIIGNCRSGLANKGNLAVYAMSPTSVEISSFLGFCKICVKYRKKPVTFCARVRLLGRKHIGVSSAKRPTLRRSVFWFIEGADSCLISALFLLDCVLAFRAVRAVSTVCQPSLIFFEILLVFRYAQVFVIMQLWRKRLKWWPPPLVTDGGGGIIRIRGGPSKSPPPLSHLGPPFLQASARAGFPWACRRL